MAKSDKLFTVMVPFHLTEERDVLFGFWLTTQLGFYSWAFEEGFELSFPNPLLHSLKEFRELLSLCFLGSPSPPPLTLSGPGPLPPSPSLCCIHRAQTHLGVGWRDGVWQVVLAETWQMKHKPVYFFFCVCVCVLFIYLFYIPTTVFFPSSHASLPQFPLYPIHPFSITLQKAVGLPWVSAKHSITSCCKKTKYLPLY